MTPKEAIKWLMNSRKLREPRKEVEMIDKTEFKS